MIKSITDIEKYLKTKDITVDIAQLPNPLQEVWQLHWYSNAGEDIWEIIYHSNTVESIVKAISDLADNFDAEEHAKLYVNSAGENGVPSLKELIEDAYDIKEFLMNIASELNSMIETQEKFQIVGARFSLEDGIPKKTLTELINDCSGRFFDAIRINGKHSSATFVFNSDIYEDWRTSYKLNLFVNEIRDILDDKNKKNPDGIYNFCNIKFKIY